MTEEEWLTTRDANAMFEHLEQASFQRGTSRHERIWQLLGCACCRSLGSRLPDHGHASLAAFERAADGEPVEAALLGPTFGDQNLDELFARLRQGQFGRVLWRSGLALGFPNMDYSPHLPYLRCLFGNPFRPLVSRDLSPEIVAIASTCYARFPAVEEAFGVLADALEELGESGAAEHCRESIHAKGCHVIDWILGKSSR